MKLTWGKALAVVVVIGVIGFVITLLTSAPHGQQDPPIANVGYLMVFAAIPTAVVLLIVIGVRQSVAAARNRR
jgi:hypothetical protein